MKMPRLKKSYIYLSISLFTLGAFSHGALAQEGPKSEDLSVEDLTVAQEKLYTGIIPGKRDDLPHLKDKTRTYNLLTWIGFIPEKTRTRVFFQASEGTDYGMERSEDGSKIMLTFDNTRVENYNLMRFIDASYFGRDVKRIDVSRKRKSVTVTISVAPGAQPNVSRKNGYIYFDFPHES